jgi:hypothetical protein
VYSASDVKSYQWDKYNFHYDYKYKWNVYPTVENDEEIKAYWKYYDAEVVNKFYLNYGEPLLPKKCTVKVKKYTKEPKTAWYYTYEVPFFVLYQQYKMDNRKITTITSRE